jgi:hypothetical protein
MCVSNPLSIKRFHGALAGNMHECSLKSSIGKASTVHPMAKHGAGEVTHPCG